MKAKFLIIGYLLLAIASCTSKVKVVEPVETPSSELCAIDSLMWRQPDSALAHLQRFVASPAADSLDAFNGHYCQLLISELLYKNDWGQSNRGELLKAVGYFDSIVDLHGANIQKRNAFLDARGHYINGVGYYERDSVVEACKEYLKALEVMESHFEEKDFEGHKAQFLVYAYNRLGDLFKDQLLAEPAITCYKQAMFYCRREPTSKYGIPVLLYNIGLQFDIAGQKDSADYYYNDALDYMPDFDNVHYRDLMVSKTIFAFYHMECGSDSIIKSLKHLVSLSADEEERTTRLLTFGDILYENKQYDSSRLYLEAVFEKQKNIPSKILAAKNLYNIYQKKGDSIKAQEYASFLADFTMLEIEKKTAVSKVNEMFKEHLTQKQEKESEEEREKAIRRVIRIIIPIAVIVALVIIAIARQRNTKLMKEQKEESDRELKDRDKRHAEAIEAERQAHRMEQAAISGRLRRKNQEVRELKDQIKQMDDSVAKSEKVASFYEEPICRLIMERVNEGQFKSKIDYINYKDSALDKQQLLDLRLAVDRHFGRFTLRLRKTYPSLTNSDLDYCCLYLLGLNDADIAALMQRAYNTVVERDGKLKKIFGNNKPLPLTLASIANEELFI
ncbi:MAG: hypothetical protein IKN08_03755 [Bacteroidales bacterium]|nr:hypothetical protein [Bacteroidales bacterium]MBR6226878.1 hypothetical protein [Bacteroidales bacterium]